uniref:Uncharacterized protein n=1 Tax=Crocodylus porosus TaxID=8502 RepID=A0A7M4FB50_CROPO
GELLFPARANMLLHTQLRTLPNLQEVLNRNSMQLLGQVAGALPEECLEDRPTFRFPEKVLRSKAPHNAWMASYEILQQLFSLFKGNLPETAWDMHSVERFLNAVHVQIKRLETCLPTNRLYPRSQNKAMKLKKYFRNIHNFLREKNYSKCAWEVVRIEAKTWFYYLDNQLTEVIRSKDVVAMGDLNFPDICWEAVSQV